MSAVSGFFKPHVDVMQQIKAQEPAPVAAPAASAAPASTTGGEDTALASRSAGRQSTSSAGTTDSLLRRQDKYEARKLLG